MRIDDVVIRVWDGDGLLGRLEEILARLVNRELFAAAQKAVISKNERKWCGRQFLGKVTRPDPDRILGLVELRRPETSGELLRVDHAVNWTCPAIPVLA